MAEDQLKKLLKTKKKRSKKRRKLLEAAELHLLEMMTKMRMMHPKTRLHKVKIKLIKQLPIQVHNDVKQIPNSKVTEVQWVQEVC